MTHKEDAVLTITNDLIATLEQLEFLEIGYDSTDDEKIEQIAKCLQQQALQLQLLIAADDCLVKPSHNSAEVGS